VICRCWPVRFLPPLTPLCGHLGFSFLRSALQPYVGRGLLCPLQCCSLLKKRMSSLCGQILRYCSSPLSLLFLICYLPPPSFPPGDPGSAKTPCPLTLVLFIPRALSLLFPRLALSADVFRGCVLGAFGLITGPARGRLPPLLSKDLCSALTLLHRSAFLLAACNRFPPLLLWFAWRPSWDFWLSSRNLLPFPLCSALLFTNPYGVFFPFPLSVCKVSFLPHNRHQLGQESFLRAQSPHRRISSQ